MCYEYDLEYMQYRAAEAREAMRKAAEDLKRKPRPAVPGAEPQTPPKDLEPIPA